MWVEECPLKIHVHQEPQNVIFTGNRVFADVIIKMRSYWIRVGLKSNMTSVLIRRGKCGHRHTGENGMYTQKQRLE